MIQEIVINYLKDSSLSQASLARYLSISDRYLADIKNGKKKPSLKVGLKVIDKLKNGDLTLKQTWINQFVSKNEAAAEFLKEKKVIEEKNKLSYEMSFKMTTDRSLYNAFLDILWSESNGISSGTLIERYGLYVVEKLDDVVQLGFLAKKDKVYYSKDDSFLWHSPQSTFSMLKSLIENEEYSFREGNNQGRTRWSVWDTNRKGYIKMLESIIKHNEEIEKISEENQTSSPDDEVIRVAWFNGITVLKSLVCALFFCGFLSVNDPMYAAGAGGGTDPGGGGPNHSTIEIEEESFFHSWWQQMKTIFFT